MKLVCKRIGYSHSMCRGLRLGLWVRNRRFYVNVTRWDEKP